MESKIYIVTELSLWDGKEEHNVWAYKDKGEAKKLCKERIDKFELDKGAQIDESYSIDKSSCAYECFKNDDPSDNHFCIWLQARILL